MEKRAAIGLSINLLVTVIISIVILAGGIAFLYQLIGGAEEIKADLDARTQAELERLLIDEGKKVALPHHTATVLRGETHVFGLGILNIDESEFGQEFSIGVELSKAIDEAENPLEPQPDTSPWLLFNPGPYTIEENQHHSEPILVNIPKEALKGTYIFNARVFAGTEPYDNIKKFTVTVK